MERSRRELGILRAPLAPQMIVNSLVAHSQAEKLKVARPGAA